MNRSTLTRTAGPAAVFAAVLAGILAISGGGSNAPALRPLPLAANGAGTAAENRSATDARMPSMYGGDLVFRAGVTAGLPTEGPAYVLGRTPDAARVAALAKALGIDGEVRQDEQGWVAGTGNRVLRVARYAGLPWHLEGYEKGVVGSAGGLRPGTATTATATAVDATSAPAPCPSPPPGAEPACGTVPPEEKPDDEPAEPPMTVPCTSPPPGTKEACYGEPRVDITPPPPPSPPAKPSDDAARRAAQPVLDAAGVTGALSFADGWDAKDVVVAPEIDGLPTSGYETRVSVDLSGTVTRAFGHLGSPALGARYPLLDPEAAAKRGHGGIGIMPLPAVDTPCVAPCTDVPSPAPREVVKVRLGLTMTPSFEEEGGAFLVPAWLLTVDGETYEFPVVALPDRFIATPPPPSGDPDQPVCDPSPCPTKDGTEPGGSGGGTEPGGSDGSGGGSDPNTGAPPPLPPDAEPATASPEGR